MHVLLLPPTSTLLRACVGLLLPRMGLIAPILCVLQEHHAVPDDQAAAFYLSDLAQHNEAVHSQLDQVRPLGRGLWHKLPQCTTAERLPPIDKWWHGDPMAAR